MSTTAEGEPTEGAPMHCPYCRAEDTRVVDSRVADDGGAIRRRRSCGQCNRRFTTVETVSVSVVKRNGVTEPFSRDKIVTGVRKACQGRPVSEDDLAQLAQRVEEALRQTGSAEIASHDVGLAILGPLRELDEVAYLRFASVYRAFDDLDDFEAEIALLRAERDLRPEPYPRPSPAVRPSRKTPPYRSSRRITMTDQHTDHRSDLRSDLRVERGPGEGTGLALDRLYTTPGVHPYDEVTWERRDVVQTNWKTGETVFEERGVEYPDFWSVNASTIVTTKYFRGAVGSDVREWSLRQLVDRVVQDLPGKAGEQHGYFATPDDGDRFRARADAHAGPPGVQLQLSGVVQRRVRQARNRYQRASSSSVDDSMNSILNWYREEGLIFKGGSGAGLNLSRIRSSKELLSSGGTASGPVSFMRGADASPPARSSPVAPPAGRRRWSCSTSTTPTSRSSSRPRREEENKIRALRDAGFDMDLGGKDITSVQYQNANNSVRVNDEFMRAVEAGTEFGLKARETGEVIETVDAQGAVPQDRRGRVGMRRPGHPVRRHDQRLAHQPGDRPHHRVEPVQRVHVARQLLVQPRVAEPAEVPEGRRHVRRREVREGGRVHHHRDGHLHLLRRLPDRGDRRHHPRLPPARHRLRQPRRTADGDRSAVRLRRRPLRSPRRSRA